jgi:hypothetical protein
MVLLRKKKEVVDVKDFQPISLIHTLAKLVARTLSSRLAPHMHRLVLLNQSTFIKDRAIHDNYWTVQCTAKLLHARRYPAILLKVDIAKAFDTVCWPFMFDFLTHMEFPRRRVDWISILLNTASTRVIVNGSVGCRICHVRGLQQGDPMSPLLFIIGVEVLNTMFRYADLTNLFSSLHVPSLWHQISLYADDVVIFLAPFSHDIQQARAVLQIFVEAFGLHTNIEKC